MNKHTKYMADYLKPLVGRKVKEIVYDDSDDLGTVFGLQFDDGTVAWILQDPEGNGPGHLDLEKA